MEKADWEAMKRLPEWEVTVQLTRTAKFRAHAETAEAAGVMVAGFQNGVRSMQDLDDSCDLELDHIISIEAVTDEEG